MEREKERVNKSVFYAQSTSAVMSGRERNRQTQRKTDRDRERQRQRETGRDRVILMMILRERRCFCTAVPPSGVPRMQNLKGNRSEESI